MQTSESIHAGAVVVERRWADVWDGGGGKAIPDSDISRLLRHEVEDSPEFLSSL